jgi:integrase
MKAKLSDSFARTAEAGIYFDTDRQSPRGFLLRVTPAGARSWCMDYRVQATGRQRRLSIGDPAAWPVLAARLEAARLRREIDTGGDPLADREAERGREDVAALVERFVAEALPSRAERTQAEYQAMLRDHVLPALGRLKVAGVSREDIEKLHRKITEAGKARRANAVKSLVSTIFNQAIVWRMREDNPCAHVKANREHGRERYLSGAELERLMTTLERWRARRPDSVDAITAAVLTGARRGELLAMRWADVDLEAAVWTKPAQSTKQRELHRLPLSEAMVAVLRRRQAERAAGGKVVRLRRGGEDYVFRQGKFEGRPQRPRKGLVHHPRGGRSRGRAVSRSAALPRLVAGLCRPLPAGDRPDAGAFETADDGAICASRRPTAA